MDAGIEIQTVQLWTCIQMKLTQMIHIDINTHQIQVQIQIQIRTSRYGYKYKNRFPCASVSHLTVTTLRFDVENNVRKCV